MPTRTALSDLESRPHAEVFAEPPRVVRLALDAGEGVAPHRHPGTDVVIHVLEGRLDVSVDDERYELSAGELLRFSGDREVAPEAIEDSAALVVLAERTD